MRDVVFAEPFSLIVVMTSFAPSDDALTPHPLKGSITF